MPRPVVVVSRAYCFYFWKHQPRDDRWFDERLDLLQRITLPALAAVEAPLVWVWLVADGKLDFVRQRLADMDHQGVDIRLADQQADTLDGVWPDAASVLTFRVDTDDAYVPSVVDDVAAGDWPDAALIDFWRGVTLDLHTGEMRHRTCVDHQGPFLAVTQPRERMLKVDVVQGRSPDGRVSERNEGKDGRPMMREGRHVFHVDELSWIQVVHGGNALNRMPSEPSAALLNRDGPHANGVLVDDELRHDVLARARIVLSSR
jgi:hypothetical protein